jgi:hypothetical protein
LGKQLSDGTYPDFRVSLLFFAFDGAATALAAPNLRAVFQNLFPNASGLGALWTNQLEIGDMDRCLSFDNLALLIHFPRFGVPLDHVDPLDNRLVFIAKNIENLADSTLVLATDDFYLIIFFQVRFSLSHHSTFILSI